MLIAASETFSDCWLTGANSDSESDPWAMVPPKGRS